ncbi:MAG TPA: enoyl-CoA hydratase-related protein [Syntrophomonas sp.]|nr:enoyl-CoA hydratase-related protein [Syntrophomonas sp.]
MSYEYIEINIENEIAVVSLNRPKELNALNKPMILELDRAFETMTDDPRIKAVVITGEKNFAAGADIHYMLDLSPELAKGFSFRHTFNKIEDFPKPVFAAISGFALGGGLELALACDMRIASPNAKLGFPEINIGIFPGAGGTQRLPRLIGTARAKELIYTGNIITASKAEAYGLVNTIADKPLEAAVEMAGKLIIKAPVALKLAKQCINLAFNVDANIGFEYEAIAWASTFATHDQKEGMRAFVEKRAPQYLGY